MFQYLPELRTLWHFCREVYQLFNAEQVVRLARRRRTLLLKKQSYQEVPGTGQSDGVAGARRSSTRWSRFWSVQRGQRVRTNNHVERTNRKLRFDEKVRYKLRSRRSLERFLRLRLDLLARQSSTAPPPANAEPSSNTDPTMQPILV